MTNEADIRSSLLFQMLEEEEGREEERKEEREVKPQRQWDTRADMCFRNWVGTGVKRVSGLGTSQEGIRSSAFGSQNPSACERWKNWLQFCTPFCIHMPAMTSSKELHFLCCFTLGSIVQPVLAVVPDT